MYFGSGQIVQVWWGTHSQSDESWWLCRSGTSIWVGQEEGWCWLHNGKYWQSFHDVDYTAVQPFSIIFFTKANQIHSKYYFGKSINFVDELRKKKKKSSLTIVTPVVFWTKLLRRTLINFWAFCNFDKTVCYATSGAQDLDPISLPSHESCLSTNQPSMSFQEHCQPFGIVHYFIKK